MTADNEVDLPVYVDGIRALDYSTKDENCTFSLFGHLFVISIIGVLLKQLRFIGGSFGLFELMGLFTAVYFLATNTARATHSDVYFGRFILLMVGAFVSGAAVSALFFPEHFSLRDLFAMFYVTLIVFGWINFREATFYQRIGLLRNYLAGYCAIVLFLGIFVYPQAQFVWYFDAYFGRLMGLSDNPNQLAGLANAGVVLTAVCVMLSGKVRHQDIAASVAILAAGVLSQSVTFTLSLVLSSAISVSFYVWFAGGLVSNGQRILNFAIVAGMLFGIAAVVLFGERIFDGIVHLWSGGSAKGATRFAYWIQALNESLWSPLVGLGPGGHIRAEHTPLLQEVHNIFLEMFLSGGLVALAVYLFLLIVIAALALEKKSYLALFCLVALIVMGSFHTVLRHAHHWIAFHVLLNAVVALGEGEAWRKLQLSSSDPI